MDIRDEQQLGGCLAGLGGVGQRGSASKVSLDHSLKIPVGPKHLSQVLALNTCLRCSISCHFVPPSHTFSSVP